ncbi:MAG: hypothetical protein ACE5K2_02255, partial [Candidatus Zixiibacteriota bacterium]
LSAQQVLDRIVAVVGDQIILESELLLVTDASSVTNFLNVTDKVSVTNSGRSMLCLINQATTLRHILLRG